jgi:GntR family transcriptional regulator
MRHERVFAQPLYQQVRDALAGRIAAGEWKPGAVLPNEGDLAREFSVSPGTLRKALDLLEAERLLIRRQGRGTFVKNPGSEDQMGRYCNLRDPRGKALRGDIRTLEVAEAIADEIERARLQLGCDEQVYRIRRARAYEGRTFMVEDVSLPVAVFPGLAERKVCPLALIELAQAYGILLGKGEERVSMGAASGPASEVLRTPEASPVLFLDRVIETRDGRPVEWRRGECILTTTMRYAVAMS